MSAKSSKDSGYWLRLSLFFMVVLSVALLILPSLLGALTMLGLMYTPCAGSRATPSDYGYEWEDVELKARAGGSFSGYFIYSNSDAPHRAAVIIPPPLSSGRANRLAEADVLLRNGYHVFMFESRRCADMGPLSLGYKEVDEVADALDYVLTRENVDSHRIGILGFSSAGATAVMAAAQQPQLQAVIAEGGYGNFEKDAMGQRYSPGFVATYVEWAYRAGMRLMYRLMGLDIKQLSPVDVISQISPRPILLIYGSTETSLSGARQQKEAAGDNAELWIVPGAGHGNYLSIAPQEYEQRVITFFNRALLSPR